MNTHSLANNFSDIPDTTLAVELVSALEAPYADEVPSEEVKARIDHTIERYSVAKSLLELHVKSVSLCLGIDDTPAERRDECDDESLLV